MNKAKALLLGGCETCKYLLKSPEGVAWINENKPLGDSLDKMPIVLRCKKMNLVKIPDENICNDWKEK